MTSSRTAYALRRSLLHAASRVTVEAEHVVDNIEAYLQLKHLFSRSALAPRDQHLAHDGVLEDHHRAQEVLAEAVRVQLEGHREKSGQHFRKARRPLHHSPYRLFSRRKAEAVKILLRQEQRRVVTLHVDPITISFHDLFV